jgi:hypothetical protein
MNPNRGDIRLVDLGSVANTYGYTLFN